MPRRRSFRLLALAAMAIAFLGMVGINPDRAAARSAEYAQFDVQLTVLEDGTFRIVETQTVDFTDGPFTGGHRSIPLARIEGVENIAVSELVDGDLKLACFPTVIRDQVWARMDARVGYPSCPPSYPQAMRPRAIRMASESISFCSCV